MSKIYRITSGGIGTSWLRWFNVNFFILIHFESKPKGECRVYTQTFFTCQMFGKSLYMLRVYNIASCSTLMFLLSSDFILLQCTTYTHCESEIDYLQQNIQHKYTQRRDVRCALLKFHFSVGTRHRLYHPISPSPAAFPTVSALSWPKYHFSKNSFFSLLWKI